MTPDRVAEALAALEATQGRRRHGIYRRADAEALLAAAPALLKLAQACASHEGHVSASCEAVRTGEISVALSELAEAVLG